MAPDMPVFTVDGRRIHDISSFYLELNRVFMRGMDWQLGANLDALNDLLYGGYGALAGEDEAVIAWIAFDQTRRALGVSATRAWLRSKLANGAFDQATISEQLAALDAGTGSTYFDVVLEVFGKHPQWAINPIEVDEDPFSRHVRSGCLEARAIADRIANGELEQVLPLIRRLWVETEAPSACPDAWAEIWQAVRSSTDPARVMRSGDRCRLAGMGLTVRVFRGARQGTERGWSWTLERWIAEDFARRYDDAGTTTGVLCSALVPREQILALFTEGDETEVVLDPAGVDWSQVTARRWPDERSARQLMYVHGDFMAAGVELRVAGVQRHIEGLGQRQISSVVACVLVTEFPDSFGQGGRFIPVDRQREVMFSGSLGCLEVQLVAERETTKHRKDLQVEMVRCCDHASERRQQALGGVAPNQRLDHG